MVEASASSKCMTVFLGTPPRSPHSARRRRIGQWRGRRRAPRCSGDRSGSDNPPRRLRPARSFGRDAGEILKRQLARVVGHNDGGHVDLVKVAAEVAVRCRPGTSRPRACARGRACTARSTSFSSSSMKSTISGCVVRENRDCSCSTIAREHLVGRALDDDEHARWSAAA